MLLKNPDSRLFKKSRCEAREKSTSGGVFTDTLKRGDRAQRSRWAFFNSLLKRPALFREIELISVGVLKPHGFVWPVGRLEHR